MKKLIILLVFCVFGSFVVFGQNKSGWNSNHNEINFVTETGEKSKLDVDPGFRYAEFTTENRVFRFFFDRNKQAVRNFRIMDEESKLQIARGRGNWFWGNARMEFLDGESLKFKIRRNRNGYLISGPSGQLFVVENQKIITAKTNSEKEMLVQAFFVFDRVRTTQKPITNVVIVTSNK
jgi:hypothetical protein